MVDVGPGVVLACMAFAPLLYRPPIQCILALYLKLFKGFKTFRIQGWTSNSIKTSEYSMLAIEQQGVHLTETKKYAAAIEIGIAKTQA